MIQKKIRNVLRVAVLTTLLILHTHWPVPESYSQVVSAATDTNDTINFSSVSKELNSNLIESLKEGLPGFLPQARNKIVTLIDFSLPSTAKRLWTIDLESGDLLFNTYVAHGKNTGENNAESFSNVPESFKSSLGFYLTDLPYTGKHGNSLRLKGLEKNINDKAWDRAIVVHGADYVSDSFIKQHGRLGRSHGCPAIPTDITDQFIEVVKDGSLIFIYHPSFEKLKS